jgi:ABC-type spermidine/putrescine transport system permease subunit II
MSIRRHAFAASLSLLILLFLWLPLVVVAVNSLNSETLMASWGGFTTQWFRMAWGDENVRSGLRTTLLIAVASSVLSLVVAVSGALWWRHASPKARAVYDGLIYARIILPEVVFATAIFFLFIKIHFGLGLTAMIIGHTVWNSAYAAIIVQARMAGLDPALEEAAADLGATPWRTFRRVTLSALMPAIIAAGLLAFTFSFDDVVTSLFLQGTAQSPLPVVILGMIRFRITPEINAIGLLVMLFTVAVMSFAVISYATAGALGRSSRRGGGGSMLDMYR